MNFRSSAGAEALPLRERRGSNFVQGGTAASADWPASSSYEEAAELLLGSMGRTRASIESFA